MSLAHFRQIHGLFVRQNVSFHCFDEVYTSTFFKIFKIILKKVFIKKKKVYAKYIKSI